MRLMERKLKLLHSQLKVMILLNQSILKCQDGIVRQLALTLLDELPIEAQNYIRKIEELSQLPVDILSTGPDRDETLIIQNPFD